MKVELTLSAQGDETRDSFLHPLVEQALDPPRDSHTRRYATVKNAAQLRPHLRRSRSIKAIGVVTSGMVYGLPAGRTVAAAYKTARAG